MRAYAGRQIVPFLWWSLVWPGRRGELTTYRARGGHASDWANPTRSACWWSHHKISQNVIGHHIFSLHVNGQIVRCRFLITSILRLMVQSHERILRRIIRRFGNFPTTTYSNRIPSDVNVCITNEERWGRVLNWYNVRLTYPTCPYTSTYARKYRVMWQGH